MRGRPLCLESAALLACAPPRVASLILMRNENHQIVRIKPSLNIFETLTNSLGAALAHAVNHLKSAAFHKFSEVVERRAFELLVKHCGCLNPYAAYAQNVQHRRVRISR